MTGLFYPDADLVRLLPLALNATGSSLLQVDGKITTSPPMRNAVAFEILESMQPILLVLYDGLRRNRPGPPHYLYVCDAGCWTVIGAGRAKSTCPICRAKTRTKVVLPWINLPKSPSRAAHKRRLELAT